MKNWVRLGTIAVAVLVATPGCAGALEVKLQAILDSFYAEYDFPGATAAVVLPDGSVATVATGLADLEAGEVMTPETRLLAASIGKSFVAAIVLALETEGRLSQADLVAKHLGDHAWFADLPNHETMTVGHLLRHRAGLPDHVHMDDFAGKMAELVASGADAPAPLEVIGFVAGERPLFQAGTAWSYSDTGYLLLGLVIEEVTGQRYYDLVSERLLRPLGLNATEPSDRRDIPGLAVGYTALENLFNLPSRTTDETGRLIWDPAIEWTGGGLVSSSRDLALWGQALFIGVALEQLYLDRLLDGMPVSPDAPGVLYGAGVAIYSDTPHGPVYGHGGWVPGHVSSLRHYADRRVTIAFQINTDVGIVDDSSDLVPALETALADAVVACLSSRGPYN